MFNKNFGQVKNLSWIGCFIITSYNMPTYIPVYVLFTMCECYIGKVSAKRLDSTDQVPQGLYKKNKLRADVSQYGP